MHKNPTSYIITCDNHPQMNLSTRLEGEAGYKLKSLPGIIFRNIYGLIKIKFN